MVSRKYLYLLLLFIISYSLFTTPILAGEVINPETVGTVPDLPTEQNKVDFGELSRVVESGLSPQVTEFYRYIHGPGEGFESPVGIFVDREEDEIYIADSGRGEVYILERNGYPLFSFGKIERLRPVDLVVWNSKLFMIEEGGRSIGIYNYRGEKMGEMVPPEGEFFPVRMDMDEGLIYVIDRDKKDIYIFDPIKGFKGSFSTGLKALAGIAVSGGKVYLSAPMDVYVIHVFDKDGNHLSRFGRKGLGRMFFSLPGAMAADEQGRLWVIDVFNHRVRVFDEGEKELFTVGGYGLSFPVDLEVDMGEGLLYIVEKGTKRVSVFKLER